MFLDFSCFSLFFFFLKSDFLKITSLLNNFNFTCKFILFRSTNILNKKKDIISEEHLVLQGYYASIYRERRLFLWVITEPVSTVDIYRISKIYR